LQAARGGITSSADSHASGRLRMHREIATEIVIDAPARIVWDILVDFARYREWNPYIPSLAGTARTGERVRFVFRLVPGVPVPACARVLDFVPPRELRWGGGVGGLLRAEHYMILEPLSESRVRFRHGDGTQGWKSHAPFDGILVAAAPLVLPEELVKQLKVGGRLLVPVGAEGEQELIRITRKEQRIERQSLGPVAFVPLLGGTT